jgi:eukaryotic-like serine/threonine-protein kinase
MVRQIGKGNYGEVWLAQDANGGWKAVKIVQRQFFTLDRPYEREFDGVSEFEPLSRLHPGLVDILQVGIRREVGYFYYVMVMGRNAGLHAARRAGSAEWRHLQSRQGPL